MVILLHKTYLVKVTTKREGSKILKILTTWFMDDLLLFFLALQQIPKEMCAHIGMLDAPFFIKN